MDQYSKNMGIINLEEHIKITQTKVLVVGLGGLGGFIASSLVRLGVKELVIVDFDKFDESNLNRQIYSTTSSIGKSKAEVTKKNLEDINPSVKIKKVETRYDDTIDKSILDDIDIIFDAVDNIETKLILEKHSSLYNIPLIHGAIGGWYGQVGVIMPNSNILSEIYMNKTKGIEDTLKSPTFIPGIVGNMMISEFIKFILGKGALVNQILYIDVLDHEYRIIYKK